MAYAAGREVQVAASRGSAAAFVVLGVVLPAVLLAVRVRGPGWLTRD